MHLFKAIYLCGNLSDCVVEAAADSNPALPTEGDLSPSVWF